MSFEFVSPGSPAFTVEQMCTIENAPIGRRGGKKKAPPSHLDAFINKTLQNGIRQTMTKRTFLSQFRSYYASSYVI